MTNFNGRLVSHQSIPAGMELEAGSPFYKSWRVQNSGSQPWQNVRLMHLSGNITTAATWHNAPPAAPGQEVELAISLTTPATPGRYVSEWQLFAPDGQPFGEKLTVEIETIPGGQNNGRLLSFTNPGGDSVAAGATFSQILLLENSGGRRWRADYQLCYLGGDNTASPVNYPLPATIPGEKNQLTITLTAAPTAGKALTYWQLRDEKGVPFGGFIAPEILVIGSTQAEQPFEPQKWRKVVWDITGIFESGKVGGNPAAYQNKDSGIVSYGAHQVTLASGNLGRVLSKYFQASQSAASQALQQEFFGRVQALDPNLRNDGRFKELLLEAAKEPAMLKAQDDIFAEGFFNPAVSQTEKLGLRTPLGLACIYDTRIQHGAGGSDFLFGLVQKRLNGQPGQNGITETQWLRVFLEEREALLGRLADKSEKNGDSVSANFLRTSTFRVRELRALLEANNVGLKGKFTVRGLQITGL